MLNSSSRRPSPWVHLGAVATPQFLSVTKAFKAVPPRADFIPVPVTAEGTTEDHWTTLALCASHPEKRLWFPDDYHDAEAAIAVAICRVCPVNAECLDYALTTGQPEGVWGGTTPSERRRIARGVWREQ